jgi:hypothetical protein
VGDDAEYAIRTGGDLLNPSDLGNAVNRSNAELAVTIPLAGYVGTSRRAVCAAVVCNALEFFDFVTCAFFAVQIGRAFCKRPANPT